MGQKKAKKFRKEVRKVRYDVVSDLKTAINNLGFKARLSLGLKIIFKKEW